MKLTLEKTETIAKALGTYSVVIKRQHTDGATYHSINDCALCRAIREQLPEFDLGTVGGDYLRDSSGNKYFFNSEYRTGWNSARFNELSSGKTQEHVVEFTLENKL